ncbi:hypothetical protein MKX01_031267 [Papaver californicum]|nr:hypothetical protein MKX01_031267 [Papaver californicum]
MRVQRVFVWLLLISVIEALPKRILLDTDVVTDDIFAPLYLLKLNTAQIDLKAVTISTDTWTAGGYSVNQVYDILYMMDRDDIPVGVRYRQAIPLVLGGRLDTDTNYGLRRSFLPQGFRKYSPLHQPTTQQVMIDTISKGSTTIFLIGTHTNFAIFLMSNPQFKKNIEHIYVMGGGVRSKNPTGCCPKNASSSCKPQQCGFPGNLYTSYSRNPYAEFNIFGDPFALPSCLWMQQTIPIIEEFFDWFERNQHTYEAQYAFQSLKINRDTWFDDQFYTSYFMWDSFTSGIASSIMHNSNANGENEFAEMEYMNVTVVTSNAPYSISDGSNPLFSGCATPKFDLQKDGVHSGHVRMGLRDPFCILVNEIGKCQDGYRKEVTDVDGVGVLVATKAKPNRDTSSLLDREFFASFLDVLNQPQHTGRFNFTTQFPYYKEVFYKPDFGSRNLGKSVVFDMDMSAGDFISLIYLLKTPVEVINLKIETLPTSNVYVAGGHISYGTEDRGNLFSVPSNEYAEFNMFLDPIAAKTVLESELDITLISLNVQRQVSSYPDILKRLQLTKKTPEAVFTYRLLSRLHHLQRKHHRYHHMDTFLGEILGAVILGSDQHLNPAYQVKPVKKHGKFVKILETLSPNEQRYYGEFANLLGEKMQSAVIGSFREQKKTWSTRPAYKSYISESSDDILWKYKK